MLMPDERGNEFTRASKNLAENSSGPASMKFTRGEMFLHWTVVGAACQSLASRSVFGGGI